MSSASRTGASKSASDLRGDEGSPPADGASVPDGAAIADGAAVLDDAAVPDRSGAPADDAAVPDHSAGPHDAAPPHDAAASLADDAPADSAPTDGAAPPSVDAAPIADSGEVVPAVHVSPSPELAPAADPLSLPVAPERPRPLWRRVVEAIAPVVVAAIVAVVFMSLKTDRGYRYHASSTYTGYKQDGWTGRIASADIFFSTNHEMNPWVSIDLGETRTIHRVKVTNRTDFSERAIPLVVEVEEPDGSFREVARRARNFARWTFEFPPETTRRVRLRVDGRATFLHLARVLID